MSGEHQQARLYHSLCQCAHASQLCPVSVRESGAWGLGLGTFRAQGQGTDDRSQGTWLYDGVLASSVSNRVMSPE